MATNADGSSLFDDHQSSALQYRENVEQCRAALQRLKALQNEFAALAVDWRHALAVRKAALQTMEDRDRRRKPKNRS